MALPEGTPDIYYHGINLFFHLGVIVVFIILGARLLLRRREDDVDFYKKLKLAYGLILIFLAASKAAFVIAVWNPDYYDVICAAGYLLGVCGLFPVIFVNEHYLIKKTRQVFSVIGLVYIGITVGSFLVPQLRYAALELIYFGLPFLCLFVVILYLYLAGTAVQTIRRNALITILGMFFLAFGWILDGESFVRAFSNTFVTATGILDMLYSLSAVLIATGGIILGSIRRVDAAMIDFYTNKRTCIVHKGPIKGRMFICSKCNAFYCMACKKAIEQIDKCCWNCKTPFTAEDTKDAATLEPVEPEPRVDEGKARKMKRE